MLKRRVTKLEKIAKEKGFALKYDFSKVSDENLEKILNEAEKVVDDINKNGMEKLGALKKMDDDLISKGAIIK